jgi:heterodisulfide reductase subunit A-like polyferredoxin
MVKLTINGQPIEVEDGITVLKAAKELEIEIPTLCYSDYLEPYASCRLCTVKVGDEDNAYLATSCSLEAADGMVITTDDEEVRHARKIVLELLLAKCPTVEILQELGAEYGIEKSRFEPPPKPEPESEEAEPLIEAKEDRCILCGLCTRICEQRVKAYAISMAERGGKTFVSPPFEQPSPDCIACGACASICPTDSSKVYDRFKREIIHPELTLASNSAVSFATKQAVPNVPTVNEEDCIHFRQMENGDGLDACRICEEACPKEAIDLDSKDETVEVDVGAIVVATGFETFDPTPIKEYGYGRLPNVITGLEFELMCRADGMTEGDVLMENGEKPGSIAIIHCVGSRDRNYHTYCSRVCCMYSLKFAHLIKEKSDADVYQFYIDMRSPGKDYEEFYDRLLEEGVIFVRGRGAEVTDIAERPEEEGKLTVQCEDTLVGSFRRIPVDMVVLSVALSPAADADATRRVFSIGCGGEGFFKERHPKLAPVSTTTDGVFIAGTCQGPKDIPDSVAQGSAAAAQVLSLIDRGKVEIEPITASIDEDVCSGCKLCISLCPYTAIEYDEEKEISVVNTVLCKGCGTCAGACPSGAANQRHFKDKQLLSQIEGVLA